MNENFDTSYQNQYVGNSIIERGYDIYDEWIDDGFTSHEILSYVDRITAALQSKKTTDAYAEALSCLFALDIRISEKYSSFLRRIFSYFSWRREVRALNALKGALNVPINVSDIRTAIEVALKKLRENINAEEVDEEDDETHGGKRNAKAEEEAVAAEEKEEEKAAEEKSEEITEAEETEEISEEKAEELGDKSPTKESKNEPDEQQLTETVEEANESSATESEEINLDEVLEIKEANDGPSEAVESAADKNKTAATYNDAIDSPVITDDLIGDKQSDKKISFIDEVIMDNMVKGKEDYISHNPLQDFKHSDELIQSDDVASQRTDEDKRTDKDAHLYDRMLVNDKGDVQGSEKAEPTQQTEKMPEVKSEQPKDFVQKNDEPARQENEKFREPLQVDISHTQENEMRMELSYNMSPEAIEAIKEAQSAFMSGQLDILYAEHEAQANVMREQLTISNEELGMNNTEKTLRVSEPNAISSPSLTQNRK